ncbi:short-chain dehydrogenase/reductase SDR [Thalassoporum mexicanum PCC 7367]|uniref:SDR family NAD(P)-dependent oxidoreductase n=1 Tax=Thalassoporum mexicanum TaxID=3457544 RepID=UPI00029F8AF5|nr:SDR family oxidoreductase [Pseudanabaena sp. PCC 7367]AFY70272.1 short-chain dehydrogenase/reductase SDR [Pseudanabaena sp. PCC 7367]
MPLALITGASSGIGAAFAIELAQSGYDLVLVARRTERLAAIAQQIKNTYQISVKTLTADLSSEAGMSLLEGEIASIQNLSLLINNAGFGTSGNFADIDLRKQMDMINLQIMAVVRSCRAALPGMMQRNQGSIINVSSISAFLPTAGNANYGATKAYLVSFSEALQAELINTDIKIQALCPGFTYSEFHDSAEFSHFDRRLVRQWLWQEANTVAQLSLAALWANRSQRSVVFIPGWINRLLIAITRPKLMRVLLGLSPQRTVKTVK